MDKEYNLQEAIDNYLLDLLSDEEKIAFEQMMNEDENLRKEVELIRQISEAVVLKGEQSALTEMQNVSSEHELREIIEDAKKRYHSNRRAKRLSLYVTSAVAIILVLIYIGVQPRFSSQKLFSEYYKPHEYIPSDMRGGGSELEKIQIEGLYKAICQIRDGNIDEAIDKLSSFSDSFESVELREDARWNLALAYLKANQRDNVKKTLITIIDENGTYTNVAIELLEMLDMKKWF